MLWLLQINTTPEGCPVDAQNGIHQHGVQSLRYWPDRGREAGHQDWIWNEEADQGRGKGLLLKAIKKGWDFKDFEYKDRESQISAIQRTFAEVQTPLKAHYRKPGVTAVEEFPVFPDFDVIIHHFVGFK